MQTIREILMDINNRVLTKLEAKQNDANSRFLQITLLDGNNQINLTGNTVKIFGVKADNTKIFNDVEITDALNGVILIELTSQALAVAGELQCELVIYGSDSSILSSKVFTINVLESVRDDSAIESTDEFTALTQGINKLETWDSQFQSKYDGLNAEYAQQLTSNSNKIGILSDSNTTNTANIADLQNSKASQTDLNTTNTRIDNIVATAGNGTIPSELSDMRVGSDGNAYTTSGAAVRQQLSDVEAREQFARQYGYLKNYSTQNMFESGFYDSAGAKVTATIRIRTKDFLPSNITRVVAKAGYQFMTVAYDLSGNFVNRSTIFYTDTTLDTTHKWKLILAKTDTNANISLAEYINCGIFGADYSLDHTELINLRTDKNNKAYSSGKARIDAIENKIFKDKNITTLGDSLTAGTGGNGTTYGTVLSSQLTSGGYSYNVINLGGGGERCNSIISRVGAVPIMLEPFTLPADTSTVQVNFHINDGEALSFHAMMRGVNPCYVNGIECTLSLSGTSYLLQRNVAGTSTQFIRPIPLVTYAYKNYRNSEIAVVWMGTNNGDYTVDQIIQKQQLFVDNLKTDKYVIIGLTAKNVFSDIANYNIAMAKRWGNRFLDIRDYILGFGLAEAGITPTTADTTAIANGQMPPSLLYDETHFNAQGYTVIGNALYRKLYHLGYLE